MAFWSIGPIKGEYQPESFDEKQTMKVEDQDAVGSVSPLVFKGWDPREVTISFVVDGVKPDADKSLYVDTILYGFPPMAITFNKADPEAVWDAIQAMQRPQNGPPFPVDVIIPGWGGSNRPRKAVIIDASISRTHIEGAAPKAIRATISVTLKEFYISGGGTAEEQQKAEQSAVEEFQGEFEG
jgi:hypothetical protein